MTWPASPSAWLARQQDGLLFGRVFRLDKRRVMVTDTITALVYRPRAVPKKAAPTKPGNRSRIAAWTTGQLPRRIVTSVEALERYAADRYRVARLGPLPVGSVAGLLVDLDRLEAGLRGAPSSTVVEVGDAGMGVLVVRCAAWLLALQRLTPKQRLVGRVRPFAVKP